MFWKGGLAFIFALFWFLNRIECASQSRSRWWGIIEVRSANDTKSPSGINLARDIAACDLYRTTCRYLSILKMKKYCRTAEMPFFVASDRDLIFACDWLSVTTRDQLSHQCPTPKPSSTKCPQLTTQQHCIHSICIHHTSRTHRISFAHS